MIESITRSMGSGQPQRAPTASSKDTDSRGLGGFGHSNRAPNWRLLKEMAGYDTVLGNKVSGDERKAGMAEPGVTYPAKDLLINKTAPGAGVLSQLPALILPMAIVRYNTSPGSYDEVESPPTDVLIGQTASRSGDGGASASTVASDLFQDVRTYGTQALNQILPSFSVSSINEETARFQLEALETVMTRKLNAAALKIKKSGHGVDLDFNDVDTMRNMEHLKTFRAALRTFKKNVKAARTMDAPIHITELARALGISTVAGSASSKEDVEMAVAESTPMAVDESDSGTAPPETNMPDDQDSSSGKQEDSGVASKGIDLLKLLKEPFTMREMNAGLQLFSSLTRDIRAPPDGTEDADENQQGSQAGLAYYASYSNAVDSSPQLLGAVSLFVFQNLKALDLLPRVGEIAVLDTVVDVLAATATEVEKYSAGRDPTTYESWIRAYRKFSEAPINGASAVGWRGLQTIDSSVDEMADVLSNFTARTLEAVSARLKGPMMSQVEHVFRQQELGHYGESDSLEQLCLNLQAVISGMLNIGRKLTPGVTQYIETLSGLLVKRKNELELVAEEPEKMTREDILRELGMVVQRMREGRNSQSYGGDYHVDHHRIKVLVEQLGDSDEFLPGDDVVFYKCLDLLDHYRYEKLEAMKQRTDISFDRRRDLSAAILGDNDTFKRLKNLIDKADEYSRKHSATAIADVNQDIDYLLDYTPQSSGTWSSTKKPITKQQSMRISGTTNIGPRFNRETGGDITADRILKQHGVPIEEKAGAEKVPNFSNPTSSVTDDGKSGAVMLISAQDLDHSASNSFLTLTEIWKAPNATLLWLTDDFLARRAETFKSAIGAPSANANAPGGANYPGAGVPSAIPDPLAINIGAGEEGLEGYMDMKTREELSRKLDSLVTPAERKSLIKQSLRTLLSRGGKIPISENFDDALNDAIDVYYDNGHDTDSMSLWENWLNNTFLADAGNAILYQTAQDQGQNPEVAGTVLANYTRYLSDQVVSAIFDSMGYSRFMFRGQPTWDLRGPSTRKTRELGRMVPPSGEVNDQTATGIMTLLTDEGSQGLWEAMTLLTGDNGGEHSPDIDLMEVPVYRGQRFGALRTLPNSRNQTSNAVFAAITAATTRFKDTMTDIIAIPENVARFDSSALLLLALAKTAWMNATRKMPDGSFAFPER